MNLYSLQQRYRAGSARRGQGGFTMVELAIVLVIAGIILIGALKGTDMINKAKVERTVSDIRGLQGMILEYNKRYGRMPGDCNMDGVIGTPAAMTALQAVALGNHGTGTANVYDNSPDPRVAPGAACANSTTPENNLNMPWKDMRLGNIVDPSRPNLTVAKNQFDDYFGIGHLTMTPTDTTITFGGASVVNVNVITVHGIPLWMAKAIDVSIDGVQLGSSANVDGGNRGRVRLLSTGTNTANVSGAVWPTGGAGDQQLVSISYQFDTLVP